MTSREIVNRYLKFFRDRSHQEIPNVSLIPSGDSTLLFVNSGMFPLVEYLSGQPHPLGQRLVNVQRSIRFDDLDEVGDNRHTTAFHMLGNWSLGDYFKSEQLPWIYAFFIQELGLDPERIYATVFAGDSEVSKDQASIQIIQSIFKQYGLPAVEGERIFAYGREDNWWQRGETIGELGGPDSEIFYYIGADGSGLGKNPADQQDKFIEIGNSVFMQYRKTVLGWEELPQKNVDFGGGLERIAMVVQGKTDIFQTDNFWPIIRPLEVLSQKKYSHSTNPEIIRTMRVLADHARAAVFLAMDGVMPSNKDQGYALRRYLRRIARFQRKLGIDQEISAELINVVAETFAWLYPQLQEQKTAMVEIFKAEIERFQQMLSKVAPQFTEEINQQFQDQSSAATVEALTSLATVYQQTYGYPIDLALEDIQELGFSIDPIRFFKLHQSITRQHQALSRQGAARKFKGGLADHQQETIRYHTLTHLLHWALRRTLGAQVLQRGSNITGERLRFDFNHDQKLGDREIEQVEKLINDQIQARLPVNSIVLPKPEAERTGAIHAFGEKYPDQVTVYYIGDSLEQAISKEFCGGPHVRNTSELEPIRIYKQESIGKGLRRVYARFR